MILKRWDKKVTWTKYNEYLFILKSVIDCKLIIIANVYRRLTQLKANMKLRQLWYRELRYTSHTSLKYFEKLFSWQNWTWIRVFLK